MIPNNTPNSILDKAGTLQLHILWRWNGNVNVRKNCSVVPVCTHRLGKQQIQITCFHKLTKSCCFTQVQLDTTAAPVIHHANILHTWRLDKINYGIGRHHGFQGLHEHTANVLVLAWMYVSNNAINTHTVKQRPLPVHVVIHCQLNQGWAV